MNILLLTDHFLPNIGGGEFVVHYWAESLVRRGHTVVVPTLKPFLRKFKETMSYPYVVHRFPYVPYLPDWSRMQQFRLLHKRFKFDVIHANFIHQAGTVGVKFQEKFGIPCIATAQGGDIHTYPELGYGNLLDQKVKIETANTLKKLSRIIYTSRRLKEEMIQLGANPDRMSYVVNGTPYHNIQSDKRETIRKSLGIDDDTMLFVCISRNSTIKGLHLVLEAVKKIRDVKYKFKVVIGGLHTEKLQPVVENNGLANHIKIIGTLPVEIDPSTKIPLMPTRAVVDYLCASDVFLAPALSGGFELSAMDAMAAGLAIIISEKIGNQDLIENDKNGYVVNNNNADSIAEAMVKLLQNPEATRKMGVYNREISKQYDWDQIAIQLEKEYLALTSAR